MSDTPHLPHRAPDAATPPSAADPAALTHVRPDGAVLMVDVTDKAPTRRVAHARATLITRPDVIAMLVAGELPKGEALATARVAGIMGAKQTSSLIPLCHPLPLSGATVDFTPQHDRVLIETMVKTTGVTGVEMEALTAASVAALTLYDMIKAVDKLASITDIAVVSKSGGKSGDWVRPAGGAAAGSPVSPGEAAAGDASVGAAVSPSKAAAGDAPVGAAVSPGAGGDVPAGAAHAAAVAAAEAVTGESQATP